VLGLNPRVSLVTSDARSTRLNNTKHLLSRCLREPQRIMIEPVILLVQIHPGPPFIEQDPISRALTAEVNYHFSLGTIVSQVQGT